MPQYNVMSLIRVTKAWAGSTAANIAIRGGASVCALAAQFLIIRSQGEEAYGEYSNIIATVSLLAIFTKLGGEIAATRLAALDTDAQQNYRPNLALALLLSSTLPLAILVVVAYTIATSILATSSTGGLVLLLSLISFTGCSFLASILRGYEQNTIVDVIDGLARPVLMVAIGFVVMAIPELMRSNYGSVIEAYILTNCLVAMGLYRMAKPNIKALGVLRATLELPVRHIFRHYSGFQIAATLASFAIFQLDTYILAAHVDSIQIGGYSVACNYVRTVIFIAAILAARSQAKLAREYHYCNISIFRQVYFRVALKAAGASIVAFIAIFFFGASLMEATSPRYTGLAVALTILAGGHCFNSVAIIGLTALNMAGQNIESFISTATGAVTAAVGYFILIPSYGAAGAAASAAAGMILMSICSIYFVSRIRR